MDCTDLSGKELDRQVAKSIAVTPGKPTWCNGSTLALNARTGSLSYALGAIFHIFITPTTLVAVTMILHKPCTEWLWNLSCVDVCQVTTYTYVIVSNKRLTIPEGRVY